MKAKLIDLRIINTTTNRISTRYKHIISSTDGLEEQIASCTSFLPTTSSLYERVYCILHNLSEVPKCKFCQQPMLFSEGKKTYGQYHRHCSQRDHTVRNKYISTMIDKYGTSAPIHNEAIRTKIRTTMHEKYGEYYYTNTGIPRLTMINNHNGHDASTHRILHATQYVDDPGWLVEQNAQLTLYEIADVAGVSPSLIQKRFQEHGIVPKRHATSAPERELYEFLTQHNVDVKLRHQVAGVEVDLFLEEYGVGIELDGLYWHGESKGKDRHYHSRKTKRCASSHVQLIHVTDYEWYTQSDIVKSRLLSVIGKSKRYYARKCTLVQVSIPVRKRFFNDNHIQGDVGASVAYGLMHEGTLVQVMSFGKPRYNKECDWELIRLASLRGCTVVGGASKLMRHFVNQHNPNKIISYSDNRWGTGNVYAQMGFTHRGDSAPNYFYFTSNYVVTGVHSRVKFQKHKLLQLFPDSEPQQTEWEIMSAHGYDRYWDCGNGVWVMDVSNIHRREDNHLG